MSYKTHMKGYEDIRTLYQTDALYSWAHGRYFPPVVVEISPTHRCNQLCRYCYANKRGDANDRIDDSALVDVFAQIGKAGVQAMEIQGTGEPLVHKALPEAVEAGAKNGLSIGITTNGVLLNDRFQEKALQHLHFVKFSVLESDPKRYAYLHGCDEKQWHDLMKNIDLAVKNRKDKKLSTALFATVYLSRENFDTSYNVIKFFKDKGLDYIVVQEATYNDYCPAGKEPYFSDSVPPEAVRDMKEKISSLNDEDFAVKIRFPINDGKFCVGIDSSSWKKGYCQGIKFSTTVASDGEVYPCWRMWGKKAYSYGNIYKESFEDIWKGEKRKEVENYIFNTPPCGGDEFSSECNHCNITKLNDILFKYANATSKWKGFLLQ